MEHPIILDVDERDKKSFIYKYIHFKYIEESWIDYTVHYYLKYKVLSIGKYSNKYSLIFVGINFFYKFMYANFFAKLKQILLFRFFLIRRKTIKEMFLLALVQTSMRMVQDCY